MSYLRTYASYFILAALGIFVLKLYFGDILHHPNRYLFGKDMDALKNYFTPAWYVKYDDGLHFSGMNHPYGDHVFFTDNQPLLSGLLKFIHTKITPIADQTVGILNALMLASLIVCMLLIFSILQHFHIPPWFAIPFALVITFLSPQIHRFNGHFALAYTSFVPLLWWLLIKSGQPKRKWLMYGLLVLTITLSGAIHPYYLLMGTLFAFAYFSIEAFGLRKEKYTVWLLPLIKGFVALALPIIAIQLFLGITDGVPDRPSNPYGFFAYQTRWYSVFLPVQGPFWDAWNRLQQLPRPSIEGFSYVGLVTTIVLIASIFRAGKKIIRGNWASAFSPAMPEALSIGFWAGFALLLFSMAIPFIWGLEFLLDIFTPLKQFRSLGRFAWVFFYTSSVYATVYLYLVYRRLSQKRLKTLGIWIISIACMFWAWEGALHVQTHGLIIKAQQGKNLYRLGTPDIKAWLGEIEKQPEDFQAILPIPAYFIGSEKFSSRWTSPFAASMAYKVAFDTGLPLACGSMSRTSFSQSMKLVQILSDPHIEKRIIDDYPNDKPILVLRQHNVPLTLNQQYLLRRADILIQKDDFSLLELKLDQLGGRGVEKIQQFNELGDSILHQYGPLYVDKDSSFVFFDGFGKGLEFGMETKKAEKEKLMIFDDIIPTDEKLHVSFWLKADPTVSGFPALYYREFNAAGEEVKLDEIITKTGTNVFEDWLLVEYRFTPITRGNRVHLYLLGEKADVESLLIKPDNASVYLPLEGKQVLMYNNFYLEK